MAIQDEKTSRTNLLSIAREWGVEEDLKKIFARYDDLLKGCRTDEERKAVGTAGVIELHNLLDGRKNGSLVVDGIVVK